MANRSRPYCVTNFHVRKRLHLAFAAIACLPAALWLAGCQAPPEPRIKGNEPQLIRPPVQPHTTAGTSAEHRPIETLVFGTGADVVLIMGTIHGDEPAGALLTETLAAYLKQHGDMLNGRTVVIMPVANPDGMARNTRLNANGVDLNRNFAAPNRLNSAENGLFALSEPESRVISRILDLYGPDRIVSIHQPLSCIDYDGPGEALARQMAAQCDLPVRKLGARPGSLGAYAGETLHIPMITVELKANDHKLPRNQLWDEYGRMLLAAIMYPDPVPAPTDQI